MIMMKDWIKYLGGFLLIILIFVFSVVLNPSAEFGGADDAGKGAIEELSPGYQQWFAPLWKPKPETESMLFALQAAIGAIIIGYFIGYERARKKFSSADSPSSS